MEAIDVGWLSLIPPLLAIGLALITKEVISSLLIGVFTGAVIYAMHTGGNIITAATVTFELMGEKIGDNAEILIFLGLLGSLVAIVTMAGGSRAYGNWAASKIKKKQSAQLATFALGCLIFIDDYFNCLTIGTVMRPVTDKHHISRAKLAYIIDATAAPVCIIAPISSWAASVISQIQDSSEQLNGMSIFMQAIPFNLYAILTMLMVIIICVTTIDFGPMAKFERMAKEDANVGAVNSTLGQDDELAHMKISDKGRVFDLLIPILALIICSILAMLYMGGYFESPITISEAFRNTDASPALVLGSFAALLIAFVLFIPRKLLTFKEFMEGIGIGVRSMVGAYIILILAWSIGGVCRELLNTGDYIGNLVAQSSMLPAFIPTIIFIIAAFLAFSMGTSWGTFTILIPIVVVACEQVAPELMVISIAAVLAGSVLGDHCSPISDTTILSSTGAGCNHIDHVTTQIPYVILVGACCIVGYLIAGFTKSLSLTLITSIFLLGITLIILHRRETNKNKS